MAEEQPSLHIDSDWKKQAQEEKRKLAEQEAKKAVAPPPSPTAPRGPAAGRTGRALPQAGIPSLVNSVLTQALFYLGDLARAGGEGVVNLDMAKHQLDTLSVLEDKTKGNLTEEEQRLLDSALYDAQMRFVNVASQYI
jgi:hypothetical protein